MNISNSIPATGFLSLSQILGNTQSEMPALIPVSRTTWWRGVKEGRYPQGVKLSARRTAWRAEDIQALINSLK
jgi:predicted DNA-binding transcriptional regulator AlpA